MKVHDRHLDTIFDASHQYTEYTGVDLPDSSKLLNFEFTMGDHRWLYLDPYGDEIMIPKIRNRFFGKGGRESIAVCLDTGDLSLARFNEEEGKLVLYVETIRHWITSTTNQGVSYRVPKEFLPLLSEPLGLRSKKRPFSMSVCDHALFNFIDKEIGYGQLREFLTITLDLRPKGYLEIWGDSYRWVSPWERVDSKQDSGVTFGD